MLPDVIKIAGVVGFIACGLGVTLPRVTANLASSPGQAVVSFVPGLPRPSPPAAPQGYVTYGRADIQADRRGQFMTDVDVGGRVLRMLVDTGATFVSLSYDDAMALGRVPDRAAFTHPVSTANGHSFVAPVRLDVLRVGGIEVRNVDAIVMPPGASQSSLLGMSFLQRLGGFRVDRGHLVLNP